MIIYTGGTFDVLHAGHLELLEGCRRLAGPGGSVVVSLNPDWFVASYKGQPPLQPYAQRAAVLRACRHVDAVVCNTAGPDSRVALLVVRPDLIVIGDDWLDPGHDERRYHAQLGVTPEWLAERGLSIEYLPRTAGQSNRAQRSRFEVETTG